MRRAPITPAKRMLQCRSGLDRILSQWRSRLWRLDGQGGKGWLGRVGIGYDYQFASHIVAGLFGDYDFSSLKGTIQDQNPFLAGEIKQTSRLGNWRTCRLADRPMGARLREWRLQQCALFQRPYT